ncbi:MAG: nickel pincer cofactor biosynthesis protein LarC [Verrucomicrobiota bacterium]
MKTLYLDIFSGISGDMFLGAMIDLDVDFHHLERELKKLGLEGYHLHASRKIKANIEGVKFDVHLAHDHAEDHAHEHDHEVGHTHDHGGHDHSHGHDHGHSHGHEHEYSHDSSRNFAQIKELINRSTLSDWVKQKSTAVFHRVAIAEGKIHGQMPEEVHFHEVGAIDSIVDIVGACIALELLGKPRVLAASVVEGTGWINCAHGRFPVPTMATLQILGARGIALTQCDEPHELVTPTGAAILAEFAESFGPMQGLIASRIGYGLGTRDNKTRPNVLRAVLGESATPTATTVNDWQTDTIAVLETNLDDINAEILGHFVELAFARGALDVFHTPIQMKKNRPGVLLTVLCAADAADLFAELMLRETSALGVRRSLAERRKLRREWVTITTPHGEVKVKIGKLNGKIVQASPEYESCKAIADKAGIPLKQVFDAALRALNASQ